VSSHYCSLSTRHRSSSYFFIFFIFFMCRHSTARRLPATAAAAICVLIRLLYLCPHTATIYASSYGYLMCCHASTMCVLTLVLAVAAATAIYAMHESSYYYYIRVLKLVLHVSSHLYSPSQQQQLSTLCMSPHTTTIYVSSS
jgi:hypothetical protein